MRSEPTNPQPTNAPDDGDAENGKMPTGRHDTICGLRRKVLLFVILGGVLITVTAIAVGVGAGIAFNETPECVFLPPLFNTIDSFSKRENQG